MESSQVEVTRRYSKYIFLDVVKFSQRSAEAQSEIVARLNEIVRNSLPLPAGEAERSCIFIPTGDGMCIAFINLELPYDIHIQTALTILKALDKYNYETTDETRKFQVRIGINQNTDILVNDINNRLNVAGAGINFASRIMDKADGGQILVSQTVYEELQPSEKYMNKFQQFSATGKHDIQFQVYQFVDSEHIGLNIEVPSPFKEVKTEEPEPELDEVAAYYLAHAIKYKSKVFEQKDVVNHIDIKATVLFWTIAEVYSGTGTVYGKLVPAVPAWQVARKPFDEQLASIGEIDFVVLLKFFNLIIGALSKYKHYFEGGSIYEAFLFPNEKAAAKLAHSWPSIWQQFQLNEALPTSSEGEASKEL